MMNASNHWLSATRFGYRARIGVIAPAAGTVLDHEWARLLPLGVVAPGARARLDGGTVGDLEAFVGTIPQQAAMMASVKPNVVALACALGTAFRGPEREYDLLSGMAAAAGCPALGMAHSAAQALRSLGARRVALLTPYSDEANHWLQAYLTASGLEFGGCLASSCRRGGRRRARARGGCELLDRTAGRRPRCGRAMARLRQRQDNRDLGRLGARHGPRDRQQ